MSNIITHKSSNVNKLEGNTYNTVKTEQIYKWMGNNKIEYNIFQSIISNGIHTKGGVITEYNKQSSNKDNMTIEIFDYIIYIVNTNQNTYYGIGPFIEINNFWNIMTKDKYYKKHIVNTRNASTQTVNQ